LVFFLTWEALSGACLWTIKYPDSINQLVRKENIVKYTIFKVILGSVKKVADVLFKEQNLRFSFTVQNRVFFRFSSSKNNTSGRFLLSKHVQDQDYKKAIEELKTLLAWKTDWNAKNFTVLDFALNQSNTRLFLSLASAIESKLKEKQL